MGMHCVGPHHTCLSFILEGYGLHCRTGLAVGSAAGREKREGFLARAGKTEEDREAGGTVQVCLRSLAQESPSAAGKGLCIHLRIRAEPARGSAYRQGVSRHCSARSQRLGWRRAVERRWDLGGEGEVVGRRAMESVMRRAARI